MNFGTLARDALASPKASILVDSIPDEPLFETMSVGFDTGVCGTMYHTEGGSSEAGRALSEGVDDWLVVRVDAEVATLKDVSEKSDGCVNGEKFTIIRTVACFSWTELSREEGDRLSQVALLLLKNGADAVDRSVVPVTAQPQGWSDGNN
ncbi:hypothetical protein PV326_007019 [Microctonus aethiopoides]|nr:hypothetical protein PV326_007019 [Microctonus aethiopoides]